MGAGHEGLIAGDTLWATTLLDRFAQFEPMEPSNLLSRNTLLVRFDLFDFIEILLTKPAA